MYLIISNVNNEDLNKRCYTVLIHKLLVSMEIKLCNEQGCGVKKVKIALISYVTKSFQLKTRPQKHYF